MLSAGASSCLGGHHAKPAGSFPLRLSEGSAAPAERRASAAIPIPTSRSADRFPGRQENEAVVADGCNALMPGAAASNKRLVERVREAAPRQGRRR